MNRHRKLPDVFSQPALKLRGEELQMTSQPPTASPSDVRKVIVGEDEQKDWSSSLDQEDPEPPHIKEEQEELWVSQEGEQLQGVEEADITKFTLTPVSVKSEDNEVKPQSLQLHQRQTEEIKTEADGVDCGGSESDPDKHLQPDTDVKTEHCPEFKVEISDNDKKETGREPQSGLNSPKNDKVPANTMACNNSERQYSCSECGKRLGCSGNLSKHVRTHTGEKPFVCSVCGRGFTDKATQTKHMRTHTGEKPFSCLVCGKRFSHRVSLKPHMLHHARKKRLVDETSQLIRMETLSCSEGSKMFVRKDTLREHMRTHTGEKPFGCSECSKTFCHRTKLRAHMRIHTGEKRFSCRSCHQRFTWHHQLKSHQCVGSGEPVRNRLLMPRYCWYIYRAATEMCLLHHISKTSKYSKLTLDLWSDV